MTIRKRLTLYYAALLTIIIIVFGGITYGVVRFTMLNNIDSGLAETASLIVRNSRVFPGTSFGAPRDIEIDLASLDLLRAPGVYVQAWSVDDNGEYYFKEASLTAAGLGPVPLNPPALGTQQEVYHNATVADIDMRVLTTPIVQSGADGRVIGNIQVAVSMETIHQMTETLLLVMLILCGVGIVGSVVLSLWFSDRALQPIDTITEAAAGIADTNDLKTRLAWQGPNDELGRLTSVFNHMMTRIEHLFSVQQRFVADISHELRTPLTSIQGNIELIRRYGPDEVSIEAIQDETGRMSRLVNDLLMLARADYGGLTVDLYPLDLDTVVMETYHQSRVLLQSRELVMRLGKFEPVRINGNTDRIKQVLFNLIGNAIKFTPDGGEIIVGLENVNEHAVLWVKDNGIGLDAADIPRVFDRFFQSESSRVHYDDGEGFGLGLSIAKWIAEAHGGTISVSSEKGQGTTFTVIIPAYRPVAAHGKPGKLSEHQKATRPRIPIIGRNQPPPDRRQPMPELRIVDSSTSDQHETKDDSGKHHTDNP